MRYGVGDEIISKKKHPCGGDKWTVVRVGADIKIKCAVCGHVVMIDAVKFEKLVKKYFPNGAANVEKSE